MRTTALIYGTPSQEQTVQFEFKGYQITEWFGEGSIYFCKELEVLESINFRPSDIKEDLTVAISEALGIEVNDIRIDAKIQFTVKPVIPIQHTYDNLILFI